jgi:hypothetical protein
MSDENPDDLIVNPKAGDTITCPGCGEKVTLDWADGWRNDNGFTCKPYRTTHSEHIVTLITHPTEGDKP